MTTSNSPVARLRAQATQTVQAMKAASRGEFIPRDPGRVMEAAIKAGQLTVGIVMDDKVLKFEFTRKAIEEATEASLVELIVRRMRGIKSEPEVHK